LVNLDGGQIGRYTFQPGWRWSECIKPVVGTDSWQVEHIGDVYRIAPGHDAWVIGDEPAAFVEFQGAANYAKPS